MCVCVYVCASREEPDTRRGRILGRKAVVPNIGLFEKSVPLVWEGVTTRRAVVSPLVAAINNHVYIYVSQDNVILLYVCVCACMYVCHEKSQPLSVTSLVSELFSTRLKGQFL